MKKYTLISALFFSAASTVIADVDYFKAPAPNSVFALTDSISFLTDDVSNDYDDTLIAVLYRADGSWVEDIGKWTGSDIVGQDDFQFTWKANVGEGDYFVRVFEIEGDDEDDKDNDIDVSRSYTFRIDGATSSSQGSITPAAASYAENPQEMMTNTVKNVKAASYSVEQQVEAAAIKKHIKKKGKKGNNKKKNVKKASSKGAGKTKEKDNNNNAQQKEVELASTEDGGKKEDNTKIASAEMRKKRSIYSA